MAWKIQDEFAGKRHSLVAGLLLTVLISSSGTPSTRRNDLIPPYRNSGLPVEERVKDLLARMSLEEKVRQMDMYSGDHFMKGDEFSPEEAGRTIGTLGAGVIHDIYPKDARVTNALQQFIIGNNRWGIPALITCEMLHGYTGEGATAFPMSIGLAATWDREVIKEVGTVIAAETRAHGVHYGFGPNLDLGREPRWGRVAETFGEDTYLASEIGLAMVQGLQGSSLRSDSSIIAAPKHFAVHGVPQTGSNASPVLLGERSVRSDYLPVFEKAFVRGGALGTMAAYSELDGIPCAADKWLLSGVLRGEWGFKGIVISDLGAIRFLETTHHVSSSPKDSIRQAIEAGVDVQFYDFPNDFFQKTVISLVEEGKLSLDQIDRAAGSVLRLKFLLGLFDKPYVDPAILSKRFHTKQNQEASLYAALKSICLLKNQGSLLPLNRGVKTIAVIGPNADKSRLGGYSVKNRKAVTVLEGIREVAGPGINVVYDEGVPLISKGQVIPSSCLVTPDGKQSGLKGEYFDNTRLEGSPALTRIDPELGFTWPGSPGPGVGADNFSVRWTGYLRPDRSFDGWVGISSDDGMRVWVDDRLVIDNWLKGATAIETAPMEFKAGREYRLKLEMWEGGGEARAELRWNLVEDDMRPAMAMARRADVAVVVLGESDDLVGENRDVATLDLYGKQTELIKAIYATGTPVVCVLLNGRPLSFNWIAENVPAILECWFPGERGGQAVAKVLFGDYNPAGRLPITFPKSAGQLPFYYSQKPSTLHRYVGESDRPLYPFGYGLSYSSFTYSNLRVDAASISDDGVKVSVDVTNTGGRAGGRSGPTLYQSPSEQRDDSLKSVKRISKDHREQGRNPDREFSSDCG
ncbi:MAG TPA: glycoside hydrolase family 3 N-terminal domain-containing protein [Blastocatellia bacterium]|nr:glycoside hydrolase family 3 N-terminal domain-containing protein [Blastocatellia bacterium]